MNINMTADRIVQMSDLQLRAAWADQIYADAAGAWHTSREDAAGLAEVASRGTMLAGLRSVDPALDPVGAYERARLGKSTDRAEWKRIHDGLIRESAGMSVNPATTAGSGIREATSFARAAWYARERFTGEASPWA